MKRQILYITWITTAVLMGAQNPGPKTFGSPEEARDALIQAAAAGVDALRDLLGPGSADILTTGDPVQDKTIVERFKRQTAEAAKLDPEEMNPNRIEVLVGAEEWPFAVPLLRKNGRWYFDIREGKTEIRHRTIGGNELDTIQVCRGFVEAQEMYVAMDLEGRSVPQYARKIVSTAGKKDGLYWPGEDSPVAEAFARAFAEGYSQPTGAGRTYHGYRYKVLYGQGPAAADGARDYIIRDLMIGGFALIAWPAEYGVSGIKTFIVNQDGIVYEKDFGPKTAALAGAITKFNPDSSWQVSPDIDSEWR
jgi:DUF2950 family protein